MIALGVLGYLFRKFGYEPAPLVLAFVLGPMLENNLRKSLILSQGDFSVFRDPADLHDLSRSGRPDTVAVALPSLSRKRAVIAQDQS